MLRNICAKWTCGPEGMHIWGGRELADVSPKPLLIVFERSFWWAEVPEDWKKANVSPICRWGKKKDLGNYRLLSLTSIPSTVMEQVILKTVCKHIKDKNVTESSQHGFMRGKTCLTSLVAFYDTAGTADKQRAVDAAYLDFNKVYDTVSHCLSSQTSWWRAETSSPAVQSWQVSWTPVLAAGVVNTYIILGHIQYT